METIRERVAAKTYRYNGSARVYGDAFLLPGDYIYEIGDPPADSGRSFASSRGYSVGYKGYDGRGNQFEEALESGELVRVPEDGLEEARAKMLEQQLYRDAGSYRASEDGSKAAAVFDTGDGLVSLERDGDHVTLSVGVSRPYMDLPEADYKAFNPSGGGIVLEDEWARTYRQEKEKAAATPLGRVAASIKSTALKLSGKEVPELYERRREPHASALSLMTPDMRPTVSGAERGTVIAWTRRITGHGIGMSTRSDHYGIVTGDNGKFMTVMDIYQDGDAYHKPPDGYALVPIPAEGPFAGSSWKAAPGITSGLNSRDYYGGGGRIMFGGAKVAEETLSAIEAVDGRGPMERLNDKMTRQDGVEQAAGPDGPDA